jgi:D-alanyl-D-alanine carboxypeptidase
MKYSSAITMNLSIALVAAMLNLVLCAKPARALDSSAVQSHLNNYTAQENNVGALVLLHQNNSDILITSGYANSENKQQIQNDDRFHIASLTKMFTAVMIYQMVDQGRLSLEDKFIDILGDPFDGRLENYEPSTIKMALEHSSGMADFLGYGFDEAARAQQDHRWTSIEALEFATNQSPTHKAGSAYIYNSTGYVLLGEVIKKTAGNQDLNALYTEGIFATASMQNSYFPKAARPRAEALARGYNQSAQNAALHDVSDIEWGEYLTDGGMVSTAADLKKFFIALFIDKTLISQNSLDYMMGRSEPLPLYSEGGRGLMVINRHDESNNFPMLYGHLGRYLGYRSAALFNPQTQDMFILLANSSHFDVHNFMQDIKLLAPF